MCGAGIMAYSPLFRFAPRRFAPWLFRPWLVRPLAYSPLALRPRTLDDSPPGLFAPWLVRPLACSPLAESPTHRGRFAPWVYCDAMSAVHTSPPCLEFVVLMWKSRIILISHSCYNEQARGWIDQGAKEPGGESSKVRGRISQGVNKPGGERARGQKSQGANRLAGETAKGRKSQIPGAVTVDRHHCNGVLPPPSPNVPDTLMYQWSVLLRNLRLSHRNVCLGSG